jgi:hypothetical protein
VFRRAAGIGLMMLGEICLVVSLCLLAGFAVSGLPPTPIRIALGMAGGFILTTLGYRFSSGSWKGVTQAPHRDAAIAGVVLLVILVVLYFDGRVTLVSRAAWLVAGSGLVAVASWWLRAGIPARRPKQRSA